MIAPELLTANESIRLIAPDVERDAQTSVGWLEGDSGKETQRAMGIAEHNIIEPTIQTEEDRIRTMIDSSHHITWMIEYDEDIVGVVEVEFEPTDFIDAPAISFMIGDTWVRGRGVATAAVRSAVEWLQAEQEDIFIFSRYRVSNEASAQVLMKVGFDMDGTPYKDQDGLVWQNVILRTNE